MQVKEILELAIRDCEGVAAEWDSKATEHRRLYAKHSASEWLGYQSLAESDLRDAEQADNRASVARACAARIAQRLGTMGVTYEKWSREHYERLHELEAAGEREVPSGDS
jgi:hypothetical protein